MLNLRLTIAYDGTDFSGWQRQPNGLTIQECLESALEKTLGERVLVYGSGRTDAGVHAENQVANFRTQSVIPPEKLVKALNDVLPPPIRVKDARRVPEAFHARYDVRSKTYRYRILQAPICSPFLERFVWHYPYPLDRKRLAEAARRVAGEHDFTSFSGSVGKGVYGPSQKREPTEGTPLPEAAEGFGPALTGSSSHKNPRRSQPADECCSGVRTLFSSRILWHDRSQILAYEVRGNGFLRHMVRNLVGTLVEVGRGKLAPEDMATILEARDRRRAGPTAPAQGLCLMKVEY
jgi:tRNA pseudouridine38-40 synthase